MPYLIDGNNLLGSWGGPGGGEDRRGEVVRRVAAFCRTRGCRATVVFDGGPLRSERREQTLGPVSVRVPPAGGDADSVIRALIDASSNPAELIVVTSDKALGSYARTRGAGLLRAREWNALERGPRPPGRRTKGEEEKPERETDVEGWRRRFEPDHEE